MKKFIIFLLSILCVCFTACTPAEPQLNAEYTYEKVSFRKGEGLTLEELSSFMPAPVFFPDNKPIESISEFEDFLKENLDEYSFNRLSEEGIETVYLKPEIISVSLSETELTFKTENQTTSHPFTKEGNSYLTDTEAQFYFSGGEFRTDLPLTDNFSIVYHYAL